MCQDADSSKRPNTTYNTVRTETTKRSAGDEVMQDTDKASQGATAPDGAQSLMPTPVEVRDQVARILEAPEFDAGPKIKAFLRYIVEQTLSGGARNLKQYSIATEALGRDATFDPEVDPLVRLEAGKLRKALEIFYLRTGDFATVRIHVPKGTYVPVFERCAPAGTRAELPPVGATSLANDNSRQLDDTPRVAITPFAYRAGQSDGELFAEGLFEQLVVALSRYSDIAVVSLLDSRDQPPGGADTHTRANFVLSGSVRQFDPGLRVIAQLRDVKADTIAWSESFDLDGSITALVSQNRLASHIACALADFYGVIPHILSMNAVYGSSGRWNLRDSIHRHRYLARTLTERIYRLTRADLECGIERAPDQPMVWAALAHTIFYGNVLGFDNDDQWKSLVFRYAQRAFELDHRCAFGHVAMALYQLYEGHLSDVRETCDRILELNPHAPSTKLSAGFFRALSGDWDHGTEMLKEALGTMLHPPGWAYRAVCLNHFRRGAFEDALREINKYHAPEHLTPSLLRATILSRLGRDSEARAAAADVLRISPNFSRMADSYLRYLAPLEDVRFEISGALEPTGLLN